MRAKLKKSVKARFGEGVPARCPGFEAFLNNSDLMTWCRKLTDEVYVFVELGFNEKEDKFAVLVKWNKVREWRSSGYHQPEGPFGDEALQRIRGCQNGEDFWDLDPELSALAGRNVEIFLATKKWPEPIPIEVALERVAPAVDDALNLLTEYGMPFLKRVAEAHNVAWPEDLVALY